VTAKPRHYPALALIRYDKRQQDLARAYGERDLSLRRTDARKTSRCSWPAALPQHPQQLLRASRSHSVSGVCGQLIALLAASTFVLTDVFYLLVMHN
jgi:hypothetical protein